MRTFQKKTDVHKIKSWLSQKQIEGNSSAIKMTENCKNPTTHIQVISTFTPTTLEIDFLTAKINEESKAQNIKEEAYPFGIFIKKKSNSTTSRDLNATAPLEDQIIGGCNGSVVYGSIYTDQLWVDYQYRGLGYGKLLMGKVHEIGRDKKLQNIYRWNNELSGSPGFL